MRSSSRQRTLTVKLPGALEEKLERAAERRSAPKSALVRQAIELYVRDEGPSPRSFAAQASDLAGAIAGAPDLSTGKRHLRGYGT